MAYQFSVYACDRAIAPLTPHGERSGVRSPGSRGRRLTRNLNAPNIFPNWNRCMTYAGKHRALLMLLLLGAAGCQTVPPLPRINLNEPGWTVREGQAVWRVKRGVREIAGEILLATRADGRAFVQFSKNPFPLLTAQSSSASWQVEVQTKNKRYSGHGQPPARLIWLYLPRVLAGQAPPLGWSSEKLENGGQR